MAAVAHLAAHPELPRPTLKVAFTPDEEIGEGATLFDLERFGALCAYTLDGSDLGESWRERLTGLAKRYLTTAHRDDLATSCAFAALGSYAAHASGDFRAGYERELRTSLAAICDGDDTRIDDAIALMSICVGGMTLSRAVADPKFSAQILKVAREAAAKLAETQPN